MPNRSNPARLAVAILVTLPAIGVFQTASAQVVTNATLQGTTADMPNGNVPTGWTGISSVDTGDSGVEVDCASGVLSDSTDGGSFARALTGEGMSQTVTGFEVGKIYFVTFEQARVLHFGRAEGHFDVTLFGSTLAAPTITDVPGSDPGVTDWEPVTVGPFTATGTSSTLSISMATDTAGSDPFGGANIAVCGYPRDTALADHLIDAVSVFEDIDTDGDGVSNRLDNDDDNDGISDVDEGYVFNPATTYTLNVGASTSGTAADGASLVFEDGSGNSVVFELAANATYGFGGTVGAPRLPSRPAPAR